MNNKSIELLRQKARSLYNKNKINEAHDLYIELCRNSPNYESLYNLGMIYGMRAQHARAEELLMQSLNYQPSSDLAWNNLAIMQLSQGKHETAVNSLNRAIQLNQKNTHALNILGNLYQQAGHHEQAASCFNKAYSLKPNDPLTLNNLGNMHLNRCSHQEAIKYYEKAIKANSQYYDAMYNMGSAYQSIGNHKEAVKCYKRAHKINPAATQAVSALASVYENQGKNLEALELLSPLLNNSTTHINVAIQYGKVCLNTKAYDDGALIINQCLLNKQVSYVDEQELRFILGDIYDKKNEYESAFKQYKTANSIGPYKYNRKLVEDYFSAIKNIFSLDTKNTKAQSNQSFDINPIFIVGMPRSGTTLIEQIISSHSLAYGAGELPYIAEIANEIGDRKNTNHTYPDNIGMATASNLEAKATSYMQKLMKVGKGKSVITDKMPHNFIFIGLIQMLFPGCKIIHCQRDPLDVCLSIYFHNFNLNHPYSDNFSNLGHYYNLYRDLMKHWHQYDNNILDVQYEAVIENPNEQIKLILDHVGLEYQDSCMQFYANERTISTPSYTQVRQPLYKSSIKRWHNYANHIDELREAINKEFLLD